MLIIINNANAKIHMYFLRKKKRRKKTGREKKERVYKC